jgi:hypothetical protein
MIKNCLICGAEFITYPSKVLLGRGKYCSQICCAEATYFKKGIRHNPATEFKKGQLPSNYRGYRITQSRPNSPEYKQLYKPDGKTKYVREHRHIMELKLGRKLTKDEIVHHINGNGLDNRIENLELMSKKKHDKMNTPLNIHKRWAVRKQVV